MAYELKATIREVRYTYSGWPHEDEEIELSLWRDGEQVPIGEVARTLYAAGDGWEDRRRALTEKYGAEFARQYTNVFDEDYWPFDDALHVVSETDVVHSRLSLCQCEETERILLMLRENGVAVDDQRSEAFRVRGTDMYKLYVMDCEEVAAALCKRETNGPLSHDEVVAALMDIYGVCQSAAERYTVTYCEYKCRVV